MNGPFYCYEWYVFETKACIAYCTGLLHRAKPKFPHIRGEYCRNVARLRVFLSQRYWKRKQKLRIIVATFVIVFYCPGTMHLYQYAWKPIATLFETFHQSLRMFRKISFKKNPVLIRLGLGPDVSPPPSRLSMPLEVSWFLRFLF